MNTDTINGKPQTLTAKELYKKLCAIHAEIAMLDADVKELLAEGKENELDVSFINTVAKANAKGKVGDLTDKLQKTLDVIDDLNS